MVTVSEILAPYLIVVWVVDQNIQFCNNQTRAKPGAALQTPLGNSCRKGNMRHAKT